MYLFSAGTVLAFHQEQETNDKDEGPATAPIYIMHLSMVHMVIDTHSRSPSLGY